MNKPVSIIIMEARKSIEMAINNTQLEPVILSLILKDICKEVEEIANTKLMTDINKYNQELDNGKENNNKQ